MEYIKKSDKYPVRNKDFISAYLEFQRIKPPRNILLDLYNQTFRGFFYRTFIVSIITLSNKVDSYIAFKSVLLFAILNLKENKLSRKYWIHGDINRNNYFNNTKGDLYFIDFENMFYTRKWPFAEIIGKGFKYQNAITFNPSLINGYLNQIEDDLIIGKLSFYYQIRFASLHKSIHEIAQTKGSEKRKMYTDFLKIVLDEEKFKKWYQKNGNNLHTKC